MITLSRDNKKKKKKETRDDIDVTILFLSVCRTFEDEDDSLHPPRSDFVTRPSLVSGGGRVGRATRGAPYSRGLPRARVD